MAEQARAEQAGPVRLTRLSATKAGTWLDCPRRYWHAYLGPKRAKRAWAHLSYGSAVHLALRDRYGDDASVAEHPAALVARHWSADGFADDAQSARWRGIATRLVERDVDEGPGRLVHSTERTLGARIDGAVVEARIDRIDEAAEAEGALVVVDYKTGRSVPSADDVRGSLALALYAESIRQSLRRPCSVVELHHLPSGSRIAWRHDDAGIARHVSRAASIATDIRQAIDTWEGSGQSESDLEALFPARPSGMCGFCDAQPQCPTGLAAAAPRASWEGLAEAEVSAE